MIASCAALDACCAAVGSKVTELDYVELAPLRMGVYELSHRHDVGSRLSSMKRLRWRVCSAERVTASHQCIDGRIAGA
jgi:hypothetical protein